MEPCSTGSKRCVNSMRNSQSAHLCDDVPDCELAAVQADTREGQQDAANQHDGHRADGSPLACAHAADEYL